MRRKGRFGGLIGVVLLAAGLFLGGCGGGGGGGGAAADPGTGGGSGGGGGTTTGSYAGTARLSGTISLANLTESEAAALSSTPAAARAARRAARGGNVQLYAGAAGIDPAANAVVKLFVVGANGALVDTGITGTVVDNGDGTFGYRFDGIKAGVNYVVRYLKLTNAGDADTTNDRVFELRATVEVPAGRDDYTAPAAMDKLSTAVTEMVLDAVVKATEGTEIDDQVIKTIVDSVVEVITNFVATIAPQILQQEMVVDADQTTRTALQAADGSGSQVDLGRIEENQGVKNQTGRLSGDEDYAGALNLAQAQVRFTDQGAGATDAQKREFVTRVFDEMMGGDGDIPGYMLEFFIDTYVEGKTLTVGELIALIEAGMECDTPGTPDWDLSEALARFNEVLGHIYALQAVLNGTATQIDGVDVSVADARKQMATVPPIFLGLFPESGGWGATGTGMQMNTPRAIAFTILALDMYLEEFDEQSGTHPVKVACGINDTDWANRHDLHQFYDFNPLLPGSLMEGLGFFAADPNSAGHQVWERYAGSQAVDFYWFEARPDRVWMPPMDPDTGAPLLDQQWSEADMLNAEVCLGDLATTVALVRGTSTANPVADYEVWLAYPTLDGAGGEIELLLDDDTGGMDVCFDLNPWREQYPPDGFCGDNNGPCYPKLSRVVSDFTSGDYTVTVRSGGTQVASHTYTDVTVLTGLGDLYATLVSPRQAPHVACPDPGDPKWNGDPDGLAAAEQACWSAWDEYNRSGGATQVPANRDTDGDGTNDAARITVEWRAPDLSGLAPELLAALEGLRIRYDLQVYQEVRCDGNNDASCGHQPVWDSWRGDLDIFTTTFTIPMLLPTDNQNRYWVGVNATFVDAGGREVGRAGYSNAELWVVDPIDPDATITISGVVDGTDVSFDKFAEDGTPEPVRVAFFYETWNPGTMKPVRTTLASALVAHTDGDFNNVGYSLQASVADLLAAPEGAWVGVTLYVDGDGDGNAPNDVWDTDLQHPDGYLYGEYSQGPEGGFWFDTWGGVVRMKQDYCDPSGHCTYDEQVVRGSVAADNVNFRVGAWLPADWAMWDDDGDGLSNGAEQETYFTDPWVWDTDWDGLSDYEETRVTDPSSIDYSDPTQADTDGDGCFDGDEVNSNTSPNDAAVKPVGCDGSAAGQDSDFDGLSDDLETAAGTDPWLWDTDGDGCKDSVEYWDLAANGGSGVADPVDPTRFLDWCAMQHDPNDMDGDGLDLGKENLLGTDPQAWDTDGDGCSDGDEFWASPASSPTDPNQYQGWCYNGGGPQTCVDYAFLDSDGDRIVDGLEVDMQAATAGAGDWPNDNTLPGVNAAFNPAADLVGTWFENLPCPNAGFSATLNADGTYFLTDDVGETGSWQWNAGTESLDLLPDGGVGYSLSVVMVPSGKLVVGMDVLVSKDGGGGPMDRDGDGYADAVDACPDVPGTYPDGCPGGGAPICEDWMLGNGVCDPICDTEALLRDGYDCVGGGPADGDGDGVPDDVDACPVDPGPMENGGCPFMGPVDSDLDGIADWIETEILFSLPQDAASPATLAYVEANLYGNWGFNEPDGGGSGAVTFNSDGTYSYQGTFTDQSGTPVNENETGTWVSLADGSGIQITIVTYTGPDTDILPGDTEPLPVVFLDVDTLVIDIDGYLERQP